MPYKNINYVKLMLELFDDSRFIKTLTDSQKLDYVLWLAMAGLTQNNSDSDPKWFKTRFNLQKGEEEIRINLESILSTFSKTIHQNGKVKFRNFKKLHNYIGKSEGDTSVHLDNALVRYDKIRKEYAEIKGLVLSNFMNDDYTRTAKAIKTLILKSGGKDEMVLESLKWAASQKWCDWTLETIIRRWPDFASQYKPSTMKLADRNCSVCSGSGWAYIEATNTSMVCDCRKIKQVNMGNPL